MKSFCRVFLLAAVFILGFAVLSARAQFVFDENPLLGKPPADFTLNTTSGQPMSLETFRQGAPAVIFFWATWCPHCREGLRSLANEQQHFAQKGVKIILVNVEESPRTVKSFIEKYKIPYPVFFDENSQVAEQYAIIGLPTLFFVDKSGVVAGVEHGLPDNFMEILGVTKETK